MSRQPHPSLPPAIERSYQPFQINESGTWFILSDFHLPYHDYKAVEGAITIARRHRNPNILLNGDVMDFHEMSDFDKDPSAPRYVAERECGLQFFAYLRNRFRKSRIIYKAGNHEEHLDRYVIRRAPALFGLEQVQLPTLMRLKDFGIEWVTDKRVVRLGRLNVIHGHEYRFSISNPVVPARGLFNRAHASVLGGHFHQTTEHHEPTITGKPIGAWSTGCLCNLYPQWMPQNKWNHGAARVEIGRDGAFNVFNFRIIDDF